MGLDILHMLCALVALVLPLGLACALPAPDDRPAKTTRRRHGRPIP